MDTLRQQQTQVNHLIAEAAELDNGTLAHKLDDGMVGRQDMKLILNPCRRQRHLCQRRHSSASPRDRHAIRGYDRHPPHPGGAES